MQATAQTQKSVEKHAPQVFWLLSEPSHHCFELYNVQSKMWWDFCLFYNYEICIFLDELAPNLTIVNF